MWACLTKTMNIKSDIKTSIVYTSLTLIYEWGAVLQWAYSSISLLQRQGSAVRTPVVPLIFDFSNFEFSSSNYSNFEFFSSNYSNSSLAYDSRRPI